MLAAELTAAAATGAFLGARRRRERRATGTASRSAGTAKRTAREVERARKEEHAALCKAELSRLWTHGDAADKERVRGFFECLSNQNWKLVSHEDDGYQYEVWRLPGEKINRIMGVATVPVAPSRAFQEFKDPRRVFSWFFPRVDPMFIGGAILAEPGPGSALCHAAFKMPAPFGGGSAPVANRDFLWLQRITKLSGGNVLVSAQSIPDADALALLERHGKTKTATLPKWKGAVRGDLQTSGYFGKELMLTPPGGTKPEPHARVWYIVQADPRGILPKWLVNLVSVKQAMNVVRLADIYRRS